MVVHAFNPGTREAEAGGFLNLRPSLVYKVSSRTARAIKRNPVSKNQKKKKKCARMKSGMVVDAWSPNPWEAEAGGSGD